jgi:hypothetical protein
MSEEHKCPGENPWDCAMCEPHGVCERKLHDKLAAKDAELARLRGVVERAESAVRRWEDWWDKIHGQKEPMPVHYKALPSPAEAGEKVACHPGGECEHCPTGCAEGEHAFTCGSCGGHHFGSAKQAAGWRRYCHDQFGKGCKWSAPPAAPSDAKAGERPSSVCPRCGDKLTLRECNER